MNNAPLLPYHSIKGRKGSVAVLDIGSSKIACFIAEPDEQGALHITGIGHHHAEGIRAGVVTDTKAAQASIGAAVSLAENMADVTLDNVIVSVGLAEMRSHLRQVQLNISGSAVSERDIADILREGCQSIADPQQEILHALVTQYQLDGAKNIRDPRNMYGMLLKADMHMITVDKRSMLNLASTISRCHLDIAEFIASPYVAGLGCLQADEQELGALVIDMGAMETGVALFRGNEHLYSHVVPIGGYHVTRDIAQGLATGMSHAERLKTLHGSVLAAANDDQAMIHVPPIGEEADGDDTMIPRAELVNIIRPRIEETFELIYDHLEEANILKQAGQHMVITGGASQLVGVRELATSLFGRQVRMGKPTSYPGLAESVSGAGFSGAVGMLRYVENRPFEDMLQGHTSKASTPFGVRQLYQWLRDRF